MRKSETLSERRNQSKKSRSRCHLSPGSVYTCASSDEAPAQRRNEAHRAERISTMKNNAMELNMNGTELNLNELEAVNGGWSWSGMGAGAVIGFFGGVCLGGPIGALIGCVGGALAGGDAVNGEFV